MSGETFLIVAGCVIVFFSVLVFLFFMVFMEDSTIKKAKSLVNSRKYEEALEAVDTWLITNEIKHGHAISGFIAGLMYDKKVRKLKMLQLDLRKKLSRKG